MVKFTPEDRTRLRARQIQRLHAEHLESGPLLFADTITQEDLDLASALEPTWKNAGSDEEVFRVNAQQMLKGRVAEDVEAEADVDAGDHAKHLLHGYEEAQPESSNSSMPPSTSNRRCSMLEPSSAQFTDKKDSQIVDEQLRPFGSNTRGRLDSRSRTARLTVPRDASSDNDTPKPGKTTFAQLEAIIKGKDHDVSLLKDAVSRLKGDCLSLEVKAQQQEQKAINIENKRLETVTREMRLLDIKLKLTRKNDEKSAEINRLEKALKE
ncbi:hypothetical protein NM208_g3845 [Fusarium decemcellulare]|uniref:Uncharacterized protein n=1 Tax=Fusarium decemcellulare TaxID=57161 RepID=A0ACC1SMK6_9HYPO|nr:hypothetical protein NM208_g3845 [Fusarium decemcellulare]